MHRRAHLSSRLRSGRVCGLWQLHSACTCSLSSTCRQHSSPPLLNEPMKVSQRSAAPALSRNPSAATLRLPCRDWTSRTPCLKSRTSTCTPAAERCFRVAAFGRASREATPLPCARPWPPEEEAAPPVGGPAALSLPVGPPAAAPEAAGARPLIWAGRVPVDSTCGHAGNACSTTHTSRDRVRRTPAEVCLMSRTHASRGT